MTSRLAGFVAVLCLSASAWAQPPGPAAVPDREWRTWIEQVRPLLQPNEIQEIKVVAPSQREGFREAFWRARNPNPDRAENVFRAQYEERVRTAEKRFLADRKGQWNDCGRTWVLLGKPETVQLDPAGVELAVGAASERRPPAEQWTYRYLAALPNPPPTLTFAFDFNCQAVGNLALDRLLRQVAASFVTSAK